MSNRYVGDGATVTIGVPCSAETVPKHTGGRLAVLSCTPYILSWTLLGPLCVEGLRNLLFSEGGTRETNIGIERLGPLGAMRTTVIDTGYLCGYPRVPLVDVIKVGATDGADAAPAVNPMVSPVTFIATSQIRCYPISGGLRTFSAAAVTSSAAVTATGVGPGGIDMLVRGPGTTVATDMPVESAKVMERKVVATLRFYGGEGVADVADDIISGGMAVASSVRT